MSLLRRPPEPRPDADLDLLDPAPPTEELGAAHDFGPPPGPTLRGPLDSLLLHPMIAILPVVLLVAVGVAAGLLRSPVYSAEARINVGRADVPAYTLQGVTLGNATLAASYARATPAPPVVAAAARAGHISLGEASAKLTGSPVPGSTLIRVLADGASGAQARAMANAAAKALIAYVIDLNGRQRPPGLLRTYRKAQRRTDEARAALLRASRRKPPNHAAVESARLDLLSAQLRSQALSTRVVQTRVAPAVPNDLQLINPAVSATSDRSSTTKRFALIGLATGLVLGFGLALIRSNAALLREHRERVLRTP